MDAVFEPMVDLSVARRSAETFADEWDLELGTPFALSNVSFVAPAGETSVLKVNWEGDDESLHEGDALELWTATERCVCSAVRSEYCSKSESFPVMTSRCCRGRGDGDRGRTRSAALAPGDGALSLGES